MRSLDRAINNSARSAAARTQCPISSKHEVTLVNWCLTLLINVDQCLSRAQLKLDRGDVNTNCKSVFISIYHEADQCQIDEQVRAKY
jgi:hypothetical protein